jgi:(hydroxyamino)benzene mutase
MPSLDRQRRLIWHGMFLFLLGLLVGLAQGQVANPRMGLAAHLEGLMNGTFLVALGAIWTFIKLSPTLTALAFWTVLYGTYANLFVTTVAAVLGANAMSPITGGQGAPAWQEAFISGGFITVGIAMIVSSVLILWGLRRRFR